MPSVSATRAQLTLVFPIHLCVWLPSLVVYHPNIYPDGSLCLDIIGERWNPTFTMGTLLASIQSLLSDPNPDSPANPEAARVFESDRKEYNRRVRRVAERSLGL